MEYYDGPIDIYDADGELVVARVPALLERDSEGRWWGRLRSEEVVPEHLREGMVGTAQGRGRVRFMQDPGLDLAGKDDRDVDFEGLGEPPFDGGEARQSPVV